MAAKLNIAVYHNLPPGGAKRSLFEIVRRLATDHKVDLFTLSCSENVFCDVRPHVEKVFNYTFSAWPTELLKSPLGRLNKLLELGNLLRLRKLSRVISRDIDKNSYDVVFVHHCKHTNSPSVLEFLETPAVYFCQEPIRWMYEPKLSRPYWGGTFLGRYVDCMDIFKKMHIAILKSLDHYNTRKAVFVLANSYFSRESIYRIYGIDPRVCYLGVDTEYFRPTKLPKENIVLSVGSVTPAKGNELIVEGLACIPERIRPTLVLASHAGNTDEKRFLQKLAADRGVTLVFHDLGDNGKLIKLYNAASVTAFTPYLEPLGLVPLESMACGTPVVGVKEAGVRETVLDGETGILVERIPEEFGNGVKALLEDKRLARQYGAKGRKYVVERWTWEMTAQRVQKYLIAAANGQTKT